MKKQSYPDWTEGRQMAHDIAERDARIAMTYFKRLKRLGHGRPVPPHGSGPVMLPVVKVVERLCSGCSWEGCCGALSCHLLFYK